MLNYLKQHLSWIIGGILICSFLSSFLFGVLDFSKDPAIVRFKSLEAIRNSELIAKCAQFGYGASDSSVREEILKEMVNEKIIKSFTDSYKLNCSDQALEQFIHLNPLFTNEKGEFEIIKFNKYLAQIGMSEALFKKVAKNNLSTQCILNSFCLVPSPIALLKSAQMYQLQSRKVCLAQLNFDHPVPVKSPTKEELRNVYEIYGQEFTLPETRSIDYCVIKAPTSQTISQEAIEQYFRKNKNQFEGKKLNQVSLNIRDILLESKMRDIKMQLYQTIDSSLNSQNSSVLEDIAQKFGGKISGVTNVTYEQAAQNLDLKHVCAEIFKTPKGHLCDPYFTREKILVCFVKNLKPAFTPTFEDLNKQLKIKFFQLQRKSANEKRIESFANKIKNMNKLSKESFIKIAATFGMSCSASFEVNNLGHEKQIPDVILKTIFDAPVPGVTPVFVNEEKAQFCVVFIENSYYKDANLVPLEQVEERLRLNLLSELYGHLYRQEEPKLVSK